MFLTDNGGDWFIQGCPDPRWDVDVLSWLGYLHGTDFEVVDESALMVHPDSGQARAAPLPPPPPPSPPPPTVPIPGLARWQSQMLTKGGAVLDYLKAEASHSWDENLGAVYYDGQRVMLQIADYTGDPKWLEGANLAEVIYRDRYVLIYGFSGYRNFSTGLRMDVERTGDPVSRDTVTRLANDMYGYDTANDCRDPSLSRECAYAMLALQDAEKLGQPHRARRDVLRESAYGHLNLWPTDTVLGQVSPFMVGLTAHAIIRDWEQTSDPRALPALRGVAEWLWTQAWDPTSRSMWYDLNQSTREAAPDLNLLIAPLYAWLWQQTGNVTYRDRGDALFVGGVEGAWLDGEKQFNQNYWWSFDYVTWRNSR
jgi:hypothetical protein